MIQRNSFDKSDSSRIFTITVAVVLFINLLVAFLGKSLGVVDQEGNIVGAGFWIVNSLFQIALFLCAFIFSKVKKIDFLKATKIAAKIKFLPILAACIVGIGIFCFISPLQIWLLSFLESVGYAASSSIPLSTDFGNVVLLVLVVAILPSICEETLFRGVITNGFAQKGLLPACVFNGLLFAVFHLSPAQTLHQFVMGFMLSLFVLKTDSILPAVIVHFVNNVVTLVLTLSMGAESADMFIENNWYIFLFVGLVVIALGLWWFLSLTKDKKVEKITPAEEVSEQSERKIDKAHIRPTGNLATRYGDTFILVGGVVVCLIFWFSALLS